MVGVAIGDALGAPLEGYPAAGPVTVMQGGGPHARRKGEWTDDTLQMLAVADSLITCRGFSPEDQMIRMLAGYRRHPAFYGPTSSMVFDLILAGRPPLQAAAEAERLQGSRSNGAVMRGPPIGVMYGTPLVQEISRRCAALTHADPVPGACSAFHNQMISDLCRGLDRTSAFSHALRGCSVPEVRDRLGNYLDYTPEPALDALLSTHAALRIFMESASFEEAVSHAVSIGGDTDTIGAICGALAGACWGIAAIPPRWMTVLQGMDRLVRTADHLAELAEP